MAVHLEFTLSIPASFFLEYMGIYNLHFGYLPHIAMLISEGSGS